MHTKEPAPTRAKPALLLALGLALIGLGGWLARPEAESVRLARRRQAFCAANAAEVLDQEALRNREAVTRARDQLAAHFTRYRARVPAFAEDLATWRTRYTVAKAALADWWQDSNRTYRIATAKFSASVLSDHQLQTDVADVIAQFGSDLEANRNRMLAELDRRVALAGVPCAAAEPGATTLAAAFLLERAPLIEARVGQSALVGLSASAGGFLATEAVTRIATRLLVAMTARLAAGAAARGSAVAAGALAGGGGGTAVAPGIGTAAGLVGGILVGWAVDWWMEEDFKDKVTRECVQILTDMQHSLWSDPAQGLDAACTQAIQATRECHERALRKVILGETP